MSADGQDLYELHRELADEWHLDVSLPAWKDLPEDEQMDWEMQALQNFRKDHNVRTDRT